MNSTLTAPGVLAIIDYDFVSWGNAYYLQEDCPGYPSYDRSDGVTCWQKKCGGESPPTECFTGTIACQHGSNECLGNLAETCVLSLYPSTFAYSSFAWCLEDAYPPTPATLESCANSLGMSYENINACMTDEVVSGPLQQTAAQQSVQMMLPGTPSVYINGESQGSTTTLLLRNVCKAYASTNPGTSLPAGCPSVDDVTSPRLRGVLTQKLS